jgi:hypothetical protein
MSVISSAAFIGQVDLWVRGEGQQSVQRTGIQQVPACALGQNRATVLAEPLGPSVMTAAMLITTVPLVPREYRPGAQRQEIRERRRDVGAIMNADRRTARSEATLNAMAIR